MRSANHVPLSPLGLCVVTLFLLALVACIDQGEKIKFAFENQTNSAVCYYSSNDQPAAGPCSEVEPQATTIWVSECGYGAGAEELPFTAVLTLGSGGREIYRRTNSCKTWQNSGGRVIIGQRDGEFVVTDNLPE